VEVEWGNGMVQHEGGVMEIRRYDWDIPFGREDEEV